MRERYAAVNKARALLAMGVTEIEVEASDLEPIVQHHGPRCTCPVEQPEGFIVTDAGCPFHGMRSRYVAKVNWNK